MWRDMHNSTATDQINRSVGKTWEPGRAGFLHGVSGGREGNTQEGLLERGKEAANEKQIIRTQIPCNIENVIRETLTIRIYPNKSHLHTDSMYPYKIWSINASKWVGQEKSLSLKEAGMMLINVFKSTPGMGNSKENEIYPGTIQQSHQDARHALHPT